MSDAGPLDPPPTGASVSSRPADADGPGAPDAPAAGLADGTWGLPDAAIAFLASWVLSGLCLGIALAVVGGSEDSLPVQLGGLLGLWLGLAGVPYLVSRIKGTGSLGRDFGLRAAPWRDVGRGLGIGVLAQLLVVPLVYVPFRVLFPDTDFGDQARDLAGDPDDLAFLVRAVAFVLVAPLVEELFYRGLLQRALVRRLGAVPGVVVGGIVFGLSHATPQPWPALAALVGALTAFGIVLGTLAHRARSLAPSIAAHVAFNGLAMASLLLG